MMGFSFVIPSLQTLGEAVFENAINFTGVNNTLLSSNITTIPRRAFYNTALSQIALPNHITEIGDEAFARTNLQSIILPYRLNSIGREAFANATSLREVTMHRPFGMGGGFTRLGWNAFIGTPIITPTATNASIFVPTESCVNSYRGQHNWDMAIISSRIRITPSNPNNLIFNIPANMPLFVTPNINVNAGVYRDIRLNGGGSSRIINVVGSNSNMFMDFLITVTGGHVITHIRVYSGQSIQFDMRQTNYVRLRIGGYTNGWVRLEIGQVAGANFAQATEREMQTAFSATDRSQYDNGVFSTDCYLIGFYCPYVLVIDVWRRCYETDTLELDRQYIIRLDEYGYDDYDYYMPLPQELYYSNYS